MTEYQTVAGLTDEEMQRKRTTRIETERRMMVIHACYVNGVKPLKIAKLYGFHVSSIKYAIKRCNDLQQTDKQFKEEYDKIFGANERTVIS